uniref:Uncharacterized protein n=1 Tax=Acrobeloides nanus TaxID=290746 RepID=A0A914EAN6_9BILA
MPYTNVLAFILCKQNITGQSLLGHHIDAHRKEHIPFPWQDEEAHSGQERQDGHNPSLEPDPFGRRVENIVNHGDVDTP